jgi:hypothetical protein
MTNEEMDKIADLVVAKLAARLAAPAQDAPIKDLKPTKTMEYRPTQPSPFFWGFPPGTELTFGDPVSTGIGTSVPGVPQGIAITSVGLLDLPRN